MLWSIIVGGFIGFLAGAITNKGGAMGVIAKVVAGAVEGALDGLKNSVDNDKE